MMLRLLFWCCALWGYVRHKQRIDLPQPLIAQPPQQPGDCVDVTCPCYLCHTVALHPLRFACLLVPSITSPQYLYAYPQRSGDPQRQQHAWYMSPALNGADGRIRYAHPGGKLPLGQAVILPIISHLIAHAPILPRFPPRRGDL